MKKNRAQKDLLWISISIFVVVALWIGFNIYHGRADSTIEPDLQLQITPIDPAFNTQSLDKIKTRKKVIPVYQLDSASGSASTNPNQPIQTSPSADTPAQLPSPKDSFQIQGQ
ncbi:MAG TPA: hypothetical protein VM077_04630 [Candidatus Limnocylindrales bacterium]|nr:hypothetical protein [Candidatus Limnocylindrales bacterium]